jgi:ferrous iron transport protein A
MSEPGTRSLSDLPVGATATVTAISDEADPHIARRLADLGLTIGTEVTVVRRAPLHDPVIYRFRDTALCLRDAQARYVTVAVR